MSEMGEISATERSEAAEPQTVPRLVRGPAGGATGGEKFPSIWLHFPSKSGNNIDYLVPISRIGVPSTATPVLITYLIS